MHSTYLSNAHVCSDFAGMASSPSPTEKNVRLVLIRHGVSEHNRALQIINTSGTISYNFRYNSNPYHPKYRTSNLLDEGRAQLIQTAEKLYETGVRAINTTAFVSPLPRTQQSAEILIQNGVIGEVYTTDKRIIEVQAGDLEGEFGLYPETNRKRSREDKDANNYETKEKLVERVKEFILSLQDTLSSKDTENVVIVSHDSVLESLVQLFNPNAEVALTPGSYLEYNLAFSPTKRNVLGTITLL